MTGCAAGGAASNGYDVDQAVIATKAFPEVRKTSHHPDSLVHLSEREGDGCVKLEMKHSYEDMLVEWSAGEVDFRRNVKFRNHALLWSRELSIASLQPEHGIQGLSLELARRLLRQRQDEYESLVQIDVYTFSEDPYSSSRRPWNLDEAPRITLRNAQGEQHGPKRVKTGARRQRIVYGNEATYRRNTLLFDRYTEDGEDLLDTERLELLVDQVRFFWEFPEDSAPVASAGP